MLKVAKISQNLYPVVLKRLKHKKLTWEEILPEVPQTEKLQLAVVCCSWGAEEIYMLVAFFANS